MSEKDKITNLLCCRVSCVDRVNKTAKTTKIRENLQLTD